MDRANQTRSYNPTMKYRLVVYKKSEGDTETTTTYIGDTMVEVNKTLEDVKKDLTVHDWSLYKLESTTKVKASYETVNFSS
jgi:uncharacterized protein YwgA